MRVFIFVLIIAEIWFMSISSRHGVQIFIKIFGKELVVEKPNISILSVYT